MTKRIKVSRRHIVQTMLTTGLFVSGPRAFASTLSNARINFAVVGVGGVGASNAEFASELGQIVAVCDIDRNSLDKARVRYPSARIFTDFREILPAMAGEVDAVVISTPNHTHAVISSEFMRSGKHVFCEKPLAHTFTEGRELMRLSDELDIVTAMNLQGTMNDGFMSLLRLLQDGEIGQVDEIHVWTNRPVWETGMGSYPSEEPVPQHLDWLGFLGPCNDPIPYSSKIHPFGWRGLTALGDGAFGDMGPHMLALPLLAFDLRNPIRINSEKDSLAEVSFPKSTRIDFDFKKTPKREAIKLSWYDGGKKPRQDLFVGDNPGSSGVIFVGREGSLIVADDYSSKGKVVSKRGATKNVEGRSSQNGARVNRLSTFVQSISDKQRSVPIATFAEVAGPLNDLQCLGNISLRVQGELQWDANSLRFANHQELNSSLHREYRAGYRL